MEAEITLKHPVKSPDTGTPIERVSLREAKAGDLFAVAKLRDATQEERSLELVRRCVTNLSPRELEELSLADFLELVARVNAGAPNFPSRSSGEAT